MTYDEIRAARTRIPFQPFKLRMKNGTEHFIQDPTTLTFATPN